MSEIQIRSSVDFDELVECLSESMTDEKLIALILSLDMARAEYSFTRELIRQLCKTMANDCDGRSSFDRSVKLIAKSRRYYD